MSQKLLQVFLLFILFFSCQKEKEIKTYNVSGNILYNNKPLDSATVSIDKKYNYTVLTDKEGRFEINDVLEGEHVLLISKNFKEKDLYISKSKKISVNKTLELNDLLCYKPVVLENTNITHNSATLTWSKTEDPEFKSYQLYRYNNFSSTTDLVKTFSSSSDSIFKDTLLGPVDSYKYFIKLISVNGDTTTSKEVAVETISPIINGSFELLNQDKLVAWTEIEDSRITRTLDKSVAYKGSNSYKYWNNANFYEPMLLYQVLKETYFVPGATYCLSMYYKTDISSSFSTEISILIRYTNELYVTKKFDFTFNQTKEWTLANFEITMPDIEKVKIDPVFTIYVTSCPYGTWWFDDVEMKRTK